MASYYTGNKISPEQVAAMLYAQGVRGDDLWKMTGIPGRESGYDAGAHRTDQAREKLSGDMGLFQMNYIHIPMLKAAGIINSPSDLFDPAKNVAAAVYVYKQAGNLSPWGMGSDGWAAGGDPLKGVNVSAAQKAVENFLANPSKYALPGTAAPALAAQAPEPAVQRQEIVMPERTNEYAPTATTPEKDPKAQNALTSLLEGFGIEYPDGPRATPQLLTFLRGLGMSIDTAEDSLISTKSRLRGKAADHRRDLQRSSTRERASITSSAENRGALISGATNTDYAEQTEDHNARAADIERALAEGIGSAQDTFNIFSDQKRQEALERTLSVEEQQEREAALAAERERAFKAQQEESDFQFDRSQAVQDANAQAMEELYATWGV